METSPTITTSPIEHLRQTPEPGRAVPRPSRHQRRSAVSDSGRSGPSSEEKAREAEAILKEKPWLKAFLGDDATFDSPQPPAVTETGLARLAVPTPNVPNTFAPPPPTPPVLDPVPLSPHSLPALSSSTFAIHATPPAPNIVLVPSSPTTLMSAGT